MVDGEQFGRDIDRTPEHRTAPRKIELISKISCANHSNSRKTKNATANEITPDSATETILVLRDIDESIMNHIPTATTVAAISALDEVPAIVSIDIMTRIS